MKGAEIKPQKTLYNQLVASVKEEASKIDAIMRDELAKMTAGADALLLEVLDYSLFTGGKRIRPLLTLLSARACGRNDDSIYRLACAFEFLHVATLVHDDVIDNSTLRRGQQAVYKKYGITPAILVGDFLHAGAMSIVGQRVGSLGLAVFCNATTGMVDGEFMQLRNTKNHTLSEVDYYNAIMGKTGLLISAACEIGAMYGGGSSEKVMALKQYGEHLGCAFQIVDDLLDYQGDPLKTGKKLGNDLLEGKMTLPLILAMERCSEEEKEIVVTILSGEGERQKSFNVIYDLIQNRRGFRRARNRAEQEVKKGLRSLSMFNEEEQRDVRQVLEGLLHYVLLREK